MNYTMGKALTPKAYERFINSYKLTSQGLQQTWERENKRKLMDNSGLAKLNKLAHELIKQ